jgi:DNA-directed RNA polymerase specialized sigma subunit
MSWQLHTQSGHDVEDLFSEACLQYLLLRPRFNPNNGTKFTTFIWGAVRNALLNYLNKQSKTVLFLEGEIPARKKQPIHDHFLNDVF